MPKGGMLTLSAGLRNLSRQTITSSGLTIPPGDYIALVVRDTGEGIPPSLMERIFEPFFTTKPRGAGTGLGLSTVIGIVRGHGGGLDVNSTQGVGTEMCILLPAAASAHTSASDPQPRTNLAGDGRTILVVDDEEPMRAVIGMALDLQGFTHVDAKDGLHAMEIFERAPDRFDAVILDQMMPRLGGDEVKARLRSMRPKLPIVLISGMLQDEGHGNIARVAAVKSDVVGLKKPFAQADLISALARAMG